MKIVNAHVELIPTVNSETAMALLEKAGRVCYKSEEHIKKGSADKFIRSIISRGHESVIEHISVTAVVTADRAVTHQVVRHRIASYSQESQRYCVAGDTRLTCKNPRNKYSIKEMYQKAQKDVNGAWRRINIKQVNEDTREITYAPIKNIYSNGVKEVYEVETRLGYRLRCTKDHEIYTPKGYIPLREVKVGDLVYVNGKRKNSKLLYRDYDWLYYQNIILNKSFTQIEKETGFNRSTLKKWATKLGVPKKGKGYYNKGRVPWNKGLTEEEDIRVKRQADALRKYHFSPATGKSIQTKVDTVNYIKYRKDRCEICRKKREELDIHHIDEDRGNNNLDNLITLCSSCHMRVHSQNLLMVHPDEVVAIHCRGREEVYDLEMDSEYSNYVANGVVVHNCNYSKGKFGSELTFIKPCFWNLGDPQYATWLEAMNAASHYYFLLLEKGATPEEARTVLPNSTKTELVMTMNLREWRHFLNVRTGKAAHPQIREIAFLLLKELKDYLSVVFGDIPDVY